MTGEGEGGTSSSSMTYQLVEEDLPAGRRRLSRAPGGGGDNGWRIVGKRSGWELGRPHVTPDFPKKTKCIPICMPGSSFMHIVTYK
jgi:hypothetical protein